MLAASSRARAPGTALSTSGVCKLGPFITCLLVGEHQGSRAGPDDATVVSPDSVPRSGRRTRRAEPGDGRAGTARVLVADDPRAVGRIVDGLVLLGPLDHVMLMVGAAEDFDDPAASRRSAPR